MDRTPDPVRDARRRRGVRMGNLEGWRVTTNNPALASLTPPITEDDIRRAMCCPDGCRDPNDCARHAYTFRQGAAAVMKLLSEERA